MAKKDFKKFKEGDKVQVVIPKGYDSLYDFHKNKGFVGGYVTDLEKYVGGYAIIRRIFNNNTKAELDFISDKYSEYKGDWTWDCRVLKLIDSDERKLNEDIDLHLIDTSKITLDLHNFVIAKVIKNDKTIITFFKDIVSGKIIKTKATCQEEDEFDLQTGVKICTAKFYIRYCKKCLHKINK